jgi:hypothetical protein
MRYTFRSLKAVNYGAEINIQLSLVAFSGGITARRRLRNAIYSVHARRLRNAVILAYRVWLVLHWLNQGALHDNACTSRCRARGIQGNV